MAGNLNSGKTTMFNALTGPAQFVGNWPGVTVENEKDRRMTIMTVTFMPCGAKLPLITCIAGALFGNNGLVAFSAYVLGIVSVVITGIMLKKTRLFAGETTPFVMELPAYHVPTLKNVWHSIWDRLKAFAKKAATVYMLFRPGYRSIEAKKRVTIAA